MKRVTLSHKSLAHHGYLMLGIEEVLSLHQILISHAVAQVGPIRVKQTSGIPQGIAPGPNWCNLYLLFHEQKYITTLLQTPEGRAKMGNAFQFWFRDMDDMLCLNNPLAQEMIREMLPSILGIDITVLLDHTPGSHILAKAQFLDLSLTLLTSGDLIVGTHRKSDSLPLKPIQYIHIPCNRPVKQSYHSLIGLVKSAVYHNTRSQGFLKDMGILINCYQRNGFNRRISMDLMERTLSETLFPGARFDIMALIRNQLWRLRKHNG